MTGTIEKVKDALHLNKDKDHTTTSTTHSSTTHTGSGVPEGTAGPHSSRAANAADPRIDSDLDSSRHTGTTGVGHSGVGTTGHSGVGTTGHSGVGTTGHSGVGTTGHSGVGTTGHSGVGTTGHSSTTTPHSSNLANKADPRVDTTPGYGASGLSTGGSGYAGTSGTPGTHATHQHNAGHNTGLTGTTGTTGGISHSTNAGPHDSNLVNKADPRVDSDLDGKGNRVGATTGHGLTGASGSHATPGSGTAQNTAGPHNSDLVNKIDPRVDADLDGSKTLGGNKTHA